MSAALALRDTASARAERCLGEAIAVLGGGDPASAAARLAGLTPSAALSPAHHSLIGRVLAGAGRCEAALPWFDAALAREPGLVEALAGRAAALDTLDRVADAVAAHERALAAGHRDPVALFNYGTLLARMNRPHDALAAFDAALRLRPAYPAALRAAGRLLEEEGNTEGALHLYTEAGRHDPDDSAAVLDRADLLRRSERLAEGLAVYDAAVARKPGEAELWNNRGMILHDLGRMADALDSLDRALALRADFAKAHLNRGTVLVRLNRQAESLDAFAAALTLQPVYPAALTGRGLALKMLGRFVEARADFDAALRLDPGFIYALANRGELNLLHGRFAEGWPEYEYRFFTERQQKPALKRPVPEWRGPGDRRRHIAVFADQGAGDTLQFSRFLPKVLPHADRVTLVCQPRLQRILRGVTAGVEVCAAPTDESLFDAQITLSSLPTAFRTDLGTLAGSRPYLQAEPQRIAHWRPRFAGPGLKVGLCWRGSQNWQCDPGRSVPFGALAPLAMVPNVRFFSLQMPDNAERLGDARALPVVDLSQDLDTGPDAFVDTAAVMSHLDLVIACDTSIPHLAGALGRPVWVLLQAVPEWRWMLARPDTPWYPTMRLFRQGRAGDWTTPVAEMVAALVTAGAMPGGSTLSIESVRR